MEQEQITLQEMNKKFNELNQKFEKLKEDLEFAARTEQAYKEIEEGKGTKMDFDEFVAEMKKW